MVGFTAGLPLLWLACGDEHGSRTIIRGDVAGVTGTTAAIPRTRLRILASVLPQSAIAQTCNARTVVSCAETTALDGNPEVTCAEVDNSNCLFRVDFRMGDDLFFFFLDDANGDNRVGGQERIARLTNDLGRVCNGTQITLSGVEIDFDAGTATARSFVRSGTDCDSDQPPQGPSPTPTGSPGTEPSPTNTVPPPNPTTEPSPTPTEDFQAQPTATAVRTLTATPTMTPTPTATFLIGL